jgi:hypothetical protein
MGLVANPEGHLNAMRLAETTQLFGMRDRMLRRLHDGDYRGAMLLCRRALSFEDQQEEAPEGHDAAEYRAPLLALLRVINHLRLEMRTR